MNEFFPYRHGQLHAEATSLLDVAAAVGTPFYLYSAAALTARYHSFVEAFQPIQPMVCYAVKANSNLAVLRLFAGLGAGADVVSEGELHRALAAGIPPDRVIFSGVGKGRAELMTALEAGIHQINVESVPELRRLSEIAAAQGAAAKVAIRVNPDVDALTHAKIATGKKENKFGIDLDEALAAYRLADALPGIEPVGVAMHIGSQAGSLQPFAEAFERLAGFIREVRQAGLKVRRVDLGGGLSIRYRDETPTDPAEYGALVNRIFGGLDLSMACEPGRVLVGPAGLLVARVEYIKHGASRRIVIVDAAMNDLIRPALYEAWHEIVPVRQPGSDVVVSAADVVGPVCETGDTFATGRELPPLEEGELVAFGNAGAYGAVMSSTYNTRPLVPEVLVSGDRYAVIRARPTYAEMLALDTVPEWLPPPRDR
ncbi:MAG: diaminopimelate decarboxylase [Alphaproteobacteria bacterium]|nr:diaminopimelate decarboxylase [Alphaproteobacteria bacterium]